MLMWMIEDVSRYADVDDGGVEDQTAVYQITVTLLYCDIQFGCHRSQTPAPSQNLAKGMASHGCPPEALRGHKMIKIKISSLWGKSTLLKMWSAKTFSWSQVAFSSTERYNLALRSQVTPSTELNIAVQYFRLLCNLWDLWRCQELVQLCTVIFHTFLYFLEQTLRVYNVLMLRTG
jgi:hypothetical protein